MLKLITLLLLAGFCCFNSAAQAAEWVEIYSDTYMDASSHEYNPETKIARMWLKMLNGKDYKIKDINGKKVQYQMSYNEFDCARKKYQIISAVSYGSQSKVLDSYENPYNDYPTLNSWNTVIPDSLAELWYQLACAPHFEED